jgi:outer membrane biosynthesis protein TonB
MLCRMISTAPAPYREPEDKTLKWVMIFILLSLLLHAILFTAIFLFSRYVPTPKLTTPEPPKENKIALSLVPPPKPIFVPTEPQANVPHIKQPIESANDTRLQSQAKAAHAPTSIMPEVDGKKHAPDMHNSPLVKAPKTPQPSTTPPTPKAQPQKPSPTPEPQMAQQVQPRPMPPQPPKPAPPKPTPPQPQVDPLTGLPVLAPISAPTMAPPNQVQPLAPAPSQQAVAGSQHGSLGRAGDTSPAAMASDLGKYKQYVYQVVGSYWYPAIDQSFSTIGVGAVHIRFTIHKDGTLSDVEVLDGDTDSSRTILRGISLNALRSPAPFKPFSPGMIKEVGDSYTDDFSFSVY